jgi:three-Cys-motif partner protein
MTADFHAQPFDEGTLRKLRIFELYAGEWLPVFLSQPEPRWPRLHVFDFLAGPGRDTQGVLGSPLRLLNRIRQYTSLPGWSKVAVHAHLFDEDHQKVNALKMKLAEPGIAVPNVKLEIEAWDFQTAWSHSQAALSDPDAAKLVLIDQTGVKLVSDDVFRRLASFPTCDFLFFVSSQTLYRFRDHPAIKQKIQRPEDTHHVHLAVVDYYRSLLDDPSRLYLGHFSIRKAANIYGIIFGSSHPRGIDKFLRVAWTEDQINGQADFDIHHENIVPGQLGLYPPTKITAFEAELQNLIRMGVARDERDVFSCCVRHGVRPQHARPPIQKLLDDGVITCQFTVPDVKKFKNPRSILLTTGSGS